MEKCRRIYQIVWVIAICLLLGACSNSDKDSSNLTDDSSELEEHSNVSRVIKEGVNDSENVIAMKDGLKDDTLAVVGKDEDGYGDLGVNIKTEDSLLLLSKDPVYDVVYYVNYNVDNFIYRIKDGKAELAVELPARRLFCQNGILYFIIDTYNKYSLQDVMDGNICSYNPVSGEVRKISGTEALTMYVDYDGIYYKVSRNKNKNYDYYFYSFATSTSEKLDATQNILMIKWRDYFITYRLEKVKKGDEFYEKYGPDFNKVVALILETLDKSKSIELTDNPHIWLYTIANNKFYYIDRSSKLVVFDIEKKVTEEIPLAMDCDSNLIIYKEMIYLGGLLQIDPKTGKQNLVSGEGTDDSIYELYTDGNNLYGLCGPSGGRNFGVMKRIEIQETKNEPLIHENEGRPSLEMRRFIFHTLPMGEES